MKPPSSMAHLADFLQFSWGWCVCFANDRGGVSNLHLVCIFLSCSPSGLIISFLFSHEFRALHHFCRNPWLAQAHVEPKWFVYAQQGGQIPCHLCTNLILHMKETTKVYLINKDEQHTARQHYDVALQSCQKIQKSKDFKATQLKQKGRIHIIQFSDRWFSCSLIFCPSWLLLFVFFIFSFPRWASKKP